MNSDWVMFGGAMIPADPPDCLSSRPAAHPGARRAGRTDGRARQRLLAHFRRQPLSGIDREEVDAHFEGMPRPYWDQANESSLAWDLQTVHAFLARLAESNAADTPVSVDWQQAPETGLTKVLVCSWDRHGLLAKIAAAFSALRINIVRAQAYTRADDLVLDIFHVCDLHGRPVVDAARLQGLAFLIEGALREPPRFASVWAAQFHKTLPRSISNKLRISFNNLRSPDYTILRVAAEDRLGLLYDILKTLADGGLDVAQASVRTENQTATDFFHLRDSQGLKLTDHARLRQLRRALAEAILS